MPLFTAILTYGEDAARRQEIRPSHREYQRGLLEQGKLYKAGPFADDSGAIIIYDADDISEAQELLANDPFAQNGIIVGAVINEWNVVMSRDDA
ncbi:MAG TPA: YciI family protein [Thermomicrobiales bacterium]|jgi:uncharacterized protein YciI|nr:YciI family protein [Thermomicrobiales bacterium]